MTQRTINSDKLRGLIGSKVHHQGEDCTIIEVLEDELAVVLRCNDESNLVQPDQFGDPLRRVPATHTIPVLSSDGDELHPAFKELEVADPRNIPG